MGVLIIAKFQGDTAKFSEALQTRAQEFIASTGALTGPPELTIAEAAASADEF
jgi:hypothetical protein